MYETTYSRAKDANDAAKKLRAADDGKYLAGGMTLLPTMKQRLAAPSDLIDLTHIKGMGDIKVSRKNVTIGAAATHADVATNAKIMKVCPSLCALASHIGDPHVRNRGTIGGSVANNDPAADYPAAMIALNATIVTNKRKIKADRFFVDLFETALKEDEFIKAVTFTAPKKAAYAKFPNPASRYAMAGVFVADHGGTKTKRDIRVGVTGASSGGVYRAKDMEKALKKSFSADALGVCKVDADDMLSDIHGSSAYRANLVMVMAKRAVAAVS
ncbi:MAG: xanthine dehydrogenase family protein subunit M [Rhizobiaceae bacterium]